MRTTERCNVFVPCLAVAAIAVVGVGCERQRRMDACDMSRFEPRAWLEPLPAIEPGLSPEGRARAEIRRLETWPGTLSNPSLLTSRGGTSDEPGPVRIALEPVGRRGRTCRVGAVVTGCHQEWSGDWLFDTGSTTVIAMPLRDASGLACEVFEIGPGMVFGFTAESEDARIGLVDSLKLGSWTSGGPVPVDVHAGHGQPTIGVGLLRWFRGGVVLDAQRHALWLLPDPVREIPSGWAEATWRIAPIEMVDDDSDRSYRTSHLPVVEVQLGGTPRWAILDTGAETGVFGTDSLGFAGLTRSVRVKNSHGHDSRGRLGVLAGRLEIAGVPYQDVEAIAFGAGDEAPNAEITIGMEILGRRPVWFDSVNGCVRIWTGEGEPQLPE